MNKIIGLFIFLIIVCIALSAQKQAKTACVRNSIRVQKMNGMPDAEPGFASGVSACYAGVVGNWLVMAGGCNFPDTPLTEGGKKRYYKGIYAANRTTDSTLVWKQVGELPVTAAYGVTLPIPGGLIFAGGMNENGTLSSVYRLEISVDKKSVVIDTLCSLPFTMDNMAGAVVGNRLFLLGGNVNGKPSKSLYSMMYTDLDATWTQESSCPGEARVQPVCAAQCRDEGYLYVWGGFAPSVDGSPATLSTDGYCYSLASRTWSPVAAPIGHDSVPVSLGGGGAFSLNDSVILCAGGVHKDIFLSALRRGEKLQTAVASHYSERVDSLKAVDKVYLSHPANWYQFNDKILVYHSLRNCWTELIQSPAMARAGAAWVGSENTLFSICGELKPGVRTPEINKVTIGDF